MADLLWVIVAIMLVEGIFSPIRDVVLAWRSKPESTEDDHPQDSE